jgi:divalent metal cation (Fe/Co/Zn/Cd) transporter
MAPVPWPVWASLVANAVLFAAKLACYIATGSLAVAASLVDSTVVRAAG